MNTEVLMGPVTLGQATLLFTLLLLFACLAAIMLSDKLRGTFVINGIGVFAISSCVSELHLFTDRLLQIFVTLAGVALWLTLWALVARNKNRPTQPTSPP